MDPVKAEDLVKIHGHKELLDIQGMDPNLVIVDESLPEDGGQMLDMRDPKVRASLREAQRKVHDTQEEIMQQLSVAMKDPEFRDHLREQHPDFERKIHSKKETPQRVGKGHYTKPKIDAPANRKKNKAARKARKKGH